MDAFHIVVLVLGAWLVGMALRDMIESGVWLARAVRRLVLMVRMRRAYLRTGQVH